MRIRRVVDGEGARLRDVRLRALSDAPEAFCSTFAREERFGPGEWERRAAASGAGELAAIFVVEEGDGWVAMAGCLLREAEPCAATLWGMWVEPGTRGRGLGERLMSAIVTWARERGASRLELEVTQANSAAMSLYERAGFMASGEARAIAAGSDIVEIPMALELGREHGYR